MAPNDDTKMDELKRLLRRLDGLESGKSPGKSVDGSALEQRDYVGALRGAPELDAAPANKQKAPPRPLSKGSVAFLAAAAATLVSSLAVYVIMTSDRQATRADQREAPPARSIVPSTLESSPAQKGSEARERLKQAADLGSGDTAGVLAKNLEELRAAAPLTAGSATQAASEASAQSAP